MTERLIGAIREQITKAHGLLEVGDDDALAVVDDEIYRLCKQLPRLSTEATHQVVTEAVDCGVEIEHRRDAWHKVSGMKPEALEKLPAEELDNLVEILIFGRRPGPGILRRIRESWLQQYLRWNANRCVAYLPRQRVPEYSGGYEGMGFIIEKMKAKGFSVTIELDGGVRFVKDGTETAYGLSGWQMDLPKTVAITALLAVRGG